MSKPSYVQTVAPTTLPLSAEEVKAHCFIDGNDYDQDILLLINAATEYVQQYQWSQLVTATWVMRCDRFPCDGIITPHPSPVSSVSSVAYVDTGGNTQTLAVNTDYAVDIYSKPARIVPAYGKSWPTTRGFMNDVVVTFIAGYGASQYVPSTTKQAMLLLIGHWFKNREAIGTTTKETEFSVKALLDLGSFRVFY